MLARMTLVRDMDRDLWFVHPIRSVGASGVWNVIAGGDVVVVAAEPSTAAGSMATSALSGEVIATAGPAGPDSVREIRSSPPRRFLVPAASRRTAEGPVARRRNRTVPYASQILKRRTAWSYRDAKATCGSGATRVDHARRAGLRPEARTESRRGGGMAKQFDCEFIILPRHPCTDLVNG